MGGSMEWNGHPNDGHGIGQLAVGVNRRGKDFGIVTVVRSRDWHPTLVVPPGVRSVRVWSEGNW